jgi:molybdenum cofactor cytidylyltransferase
MPTTPSPSIASISLVLLAAGTSSRMNGANKMLVQLGKSTVLASTLETSIRVGFGEILVVTGREHEKSSAIAEEYGAKTVFNPNYMSGMASSLVKGVGKVRSEAAGILIALGDMPFIKQASIELLCRAFLQKNSLQTICIPSYHGQRGNPVVFGIAHRQEIMRLSGDVGAKSIVQNNAQNCLEIPLEDKGCLLDIDTQEDLQDARSLNLLQRLSENGSL